MRTDMINSNANLNDSEQNGSFEGAPPTSVAMSESLIQIMWRSRWILLITTLAALIGAFAYLQHPGYMWSRVVLEL